MKHFHFNVVAALVLSAVAAGASAQATKPAPTKVTKAVMSRDELRACMKLQSDAKAKASVLEDAKAVLKVDQQKVEDAKSTMSSLRSEVNVHKDLVQQADAAVRANAARIEEWNAELKEVEASSMKTAERRKKELMNERKDITARDKTLIVQRDQEYKIYEAAVNRFNDHGKAVEEMIVAWNLRNKTLSDESDKVSDMREEYAADCASRRFREEDEVAIKQGK